MIKTKHIWRTVILIGATFTYLIVHFLISLI